MFSLQRYENTLWTLPHTVIKRVLLGLLYSKPFCKLLPFTVLSCMIATILIAGTFLAKNQLQL